MSTYAVIAYGVVENIIEAEPDFSIEGKLLVLAVEGAAIGGSYSNGVFTPPSPQIDKPGDLITYAAAKRFAVETGGVTVGGAAIDTSRDSQSMITGAYTYSQAHPSETINFKAASGWVVLDAATLAAIATAVGAHVQACFAAEAAVAAAIDAGTITTTAAIDAADWPG